LLAPFKKESVMKKLLMCLMVIFLFVAFAPVNQPAYAVNMNVDLEELSETARNEILDLEKKEEKNPVTMDTVLEYQQYGVALGKALNSLVKELGITLNDFIKSPVGKLTTAVLLWKLVFFEVFILLLKIGVMFLLSLCIGFSFMRFHVPQKKVTKDPEDKKKKTVEWIQKYNWSAGEAKMISVAIHICLIAVLFMVFMGVI